MYCLASIRQNCVFDINHRDQKYSSVTTACFKKHFCKRKIRPKSHYLCMWSKGWQWHPSFYAMFRPFLALNAFRGKQHNPQFDPPIYFIILFWCILRNYLRLNSPHGCIQFHWGYFLSWSDWRYKSSHKTATINFFFKVTIDMTTKTS